MPPQVRLAQAHAKLMCKGEATLSDAVVAVIVMESSMQGAALLGAFSPLHSAFPLDAEAEYARQESLVLERLGLRHLIRRSTVPSGPVAATAAAAAAEPLVPQEPRESPSRDAAAAVGRGSAVAGVSPDRGNPSSVEEPGHAGHALLSQRPHRPRAR